MIDFILDLVNSDEFDGLARHALSTVGGVVVAHGYVTNADWATISGGVAVAVAAVWSIASKRFIKQQAVKGTPANA